MADPRNIDHYEARATGNLELLAKQVVEGFITGMHKSPFHGFSVEFAEHRLYNTGEPVRHIDWKVFAKTDKMFVRRYEEETNLRCQLIIDNSSSMHYPDVSVLKGQLNKSAFSVNCAAAIMYMLRRQRDAVGLSVFADSVELHTKARSSVVHHKMLVHEMGKVLSSPTHNTDQKTSLAASLHQIADNIHKRSLVVIFSDMMEGAGVDTAEMFSALQHLRYNKHEVILFHVVDQKTELDFNFESRPYLFIDIETGEQVKVHTNEIKETYLKAIADYKKELVLRCGQYRIDFVEADVAKGYKQVLMPYLLKRQKMK